MGWFIFFVNSSVARFNLLNLVPYLWKFRCWFQLVWFQLVVGNFALNYSVQMFLLGRYTHDFSLNPKATTVLLY